MDAFGKCSVVISSATERIVFENVAVGEVWLAGGQSNMEFELQNELSGKDALAECREENVRFYYTPKCAVEDEKLAEEEAKSKWMLPDEENAKCWSAVGYYFARELSRRLGVTVGIIGCNWGGTSASAWMDRSFLEADNRIKSYIDEYDDACRGKTDAEMIAEYDEYTVYHEAWWQRMQKCYAENPDIKWDKVIEICGENRYPGPVGCKNPMRPCGLYQTMIRHVSPYTLAGFIYYQGESDDHRPESYYYLMRGLIENWRRDWKDSELPFMFVQLPMFKYTDDPDTGSWAVIRNAQLDIYRTVKNTGIAAALDCGEFNNIHPVDKSVVAHRLYLQAMYHVYGGVSAEDAFPPICRDAVFCDSSVRLRFDYCSGFEAKGELIGFEVAGTDGEYHSVRAEIDRAEIVLHTEEINQPVAVRFQWKNYAEVTLFGKNGMPVLPFRKSIL
jgi:sialate O-acetylesterase